MIHTTVKDCMSVVNKYDIAGCDLTNDGQQLIRIHQRRVGSYSKIKYLNSEIELMKILPYIDNERKVNEYIKSIGFTYFYQNVCYEIPIDELVEREMMKKKRRVLYISYFHPDYGLEQKRNEYVAHSLVLIFVPNKKGYDVFLMNSWGSAMYGNRTYECKSTKTRRKKLTFNTYYEAVCVRKILNYLKKKWRIECNFGEKNIYYGPNLQQGDSHGLCFMFPMMLYLYLENKNIRKIFDKKTIDEVMMDCLIEYDDNIKINDSVEEVEKFLENQKFKYLKKILVNILSTLTREDNVMKLKKIK